MQKGLDDEIRTCLSIGDYPGLYSACERAFEGSSSDKDLVIIYLFAAYLTRNLSQARGVWNSLSIAVKQDPLVFRTWSLGKELIKKNFKGVYEILDETQWHVASALAATFRIQYFQQMISTIARAYSSLSISSACELIGMNSESLISVCKSYVWRISGEMVYPKSAKIQTTNPVSTGDIERLTSLLAFLENNNSIVV